jgi:predicted permease
MNWADCKLRARALFFRRRIERDLGDEVEFHLAMETRKNLANGMSPEQAGRRARAAFGGIAHTMEECRDRRGLQQLETLAQDVRYAVRGFRKTPWFAGMVIATIAVALGLNTALFTLFDAYVLQPLAVRDPYSLYGWADSGLGDHRVSPRDFEEFQGQATFFSEVAATGNLKLRTEGHTLFGNLVTGNYFSMLGVNPLMGRTLLPNDQASVVLSAAAWKNKFAGDPAILGRRVLLHGVPFEVVGVIQPGFTGLRGFPLDFWAPAAMASRLENPEQVQLAVTVRLRPGWSARRAEAALNAWLQHRSEALGSRERISRAVLLSEATALPLDPFILAAFSPVIATLALVLVIACANVANMMLARAMARQREIGIRLAMGAGRTRLVRQLLTECLLLALPSAALGLGISEAAIDGGMRAIVATIPRGYLDFIRPVPHAPDWRVFGFMLLAAAVSTILFGLAPALQATRGSVVQAARGAGATDLRPGRLRNTLVTVQVTVSVLFLISTAMLLRANQRFEKLETGMQFHDVVEIDTADSQRAKLVPALRELPGVIAVAAASKTPFGGVLPSALIQPDGQQDLNWAPYLYASPEYFGLFEIPILRGRSFTTAEATAGSPVAVISENTARLLWPGRDALGRSFRISHPARSRTPLGQEHAGLPAFTTARVIGIAADALNGWVGNGSKDIACFYFARPLDGPGQVLMARIGDSSERSLRGLETALARGTPGAIDQIHTMDEIFALQVYPWRLLSWAGMALGGLALLLTLSGIYGVLSYVVTQRTKEIGIRIALGASGRSVSRLVLGQSMRVAAMGTLLGALASWGMIRLVAQAGVLDGVPEFDPAALSMAAAVAIAAAACAAWIPSRRAARIDPGITLRAD